LDEETIKNELNAPHQMALPMKKIHIEVKNVIKHKIHPKKAPGYDLITGRNYSGTFPKWLQSDNTNIQRHTTDRILSPSMESRTKPGKKPRRHNIVPSH
jgi:hypothetical protein